MFKQFQEVCQSKFDVYSGDGPKQNQQQTKTNPPGHGKRTMPSVPGHDISLYCNVWNLL